MPKKNDDRIIALKKGIETKIKLIKDSERFSPITNCFLKIGEATYNINVLPVTDLIFLLATLNGFTGIIEQEKFEDQFVISGFKVDDWKKDILSKIKSVRTKQEKQNLSQMQNKLVALLSDQKKTELELDDIEKLLR